MFSSVTAQLPGKLEPSDIPFFICFSFVLRLELRIAEITLHKTRCDVGDWSCGRPVFFIFFVPSKQAGYEILSVSIDVKKCLSARQPLEETDFGAEKSTVFLRGMRTVSSAPNYNRREMDALGEMHQPSLLVCGFFSPLTRCALFFLWRLRLCQAPYTECKNLNSLL